MGLVQFGRYLFARHDGAPKQVDLAFAVALGKSDPTL
jgi:hypothetical protein